MAAAILKTATKVGIGGAAVFFTLDYGVWSSSTDGTKALHHVKTKVLPTTTEYYNKVPSARSVGAYTTEKWNNGVQFVFGGLANAPDKTGELTKKALTETKKALNG